MVIQDTCCGFYLPHPFSCPPVLFPWNGTRAQSEIGPLIFLLDHYRRIPHLSIEIQVDGSGFLYSASCSLFDDHIFHHPWHGSGGQTHIQEHVAHDPCGHPIHGEWHVRHNLCGRDHVFDPRTPNKV